MIIIVVIYFMLHQGRRHEGSNNGIPRGMKCYFTQFTRFPYYEQLKIAHLLDMMHIEKNVIGTLWRIIDGRMDKEKKYVKIGIQSCNSNYDPIK